MEKLNKPYRQEYENLLNKQTEERKVFVDSAHKEALEDSRKIAALESEASEIKRGKVGGMEFIEGIEDVVEQYEKQKEILQKVGVLETLSDGVLGVKGIDGKEYAYPTQTELAERMEAKQEILETKKEQGFKKLLIAPFGKSLDELAKIYGQLIIKHFEAVKLLDSEGNQIADLRKRGKGNEAKSDATQDKIYYPLWRWEEYANADQNGSLVYFPEKFNRDNHQGKTKAEVLNKQSGFLISFIEDLPNIPRNGQGQEIGNRQQLEAGKTPNNYLSQLQTEKQYENERGLTPEEWLTYAIIHLEETNQVLDDYQGKGSINYNLAAYFPAFSNVSCVSWDRGRRQAYLGGVGPGDSDSVYGARSAVGV